MRCEAATGKSPLVGMARALFRIKYLIFSLKFLCCYNIFPYHMLRLILLYLYFMCGWDFKKWIRQSSESSIWIEITQKRNKIIALRCMMTGKCRGDMRKSLLSKNYKVIFERTKDRVQIRGNSHKGQSFRMKISLEIIILTKLEFNELHGSLCKWNNSQISQPACQGHC